MQNVVLKQMSGYRPANSATVTKETSLGSDVQSSAKPPPPPTKRRLMSVYQGKLVNAKINTCMLSSL